MAAGITANPCIIWNGHALSICLPGGAFEPDGGMRWSGRATRPTDVPTFPRPRQRRLNRRSARATKVKSGRLEMSERRITQLFGLILCALFTCTLVLNAFAF